MSLKIRKLFVLFLLVLIFGSFKIFPNNFLPDSSAIEEESIFDEHAITQAIEEKPSLQLGQDPTFGPLLTSNIISTASKIHDGVWSWSQILAMAEQGEVEQKSKKEGLVEVKNNQVEIVVGVRNELAIATKSDRHFSVLLQNFTVEKELSKLDSVVLKIPLNEMKSFLECVQLAPSIRYLEPNYLLTIAGMPNDPQYSSQWGLDRIYAPEAWAIESGNFTEVLVAIIDTGIDYSHPDLSTQYVSLGYDWFNDDNDPMDDHNHGTHCAGVIAATINNSLGIAGIANVKIMAEKFLSSTGLGTTDDAAAAIIHAVDAGADVLSNSWTGAEASVLLQDAFVYAAEHNVVSIAAAGNAYSNYFYYPAAYPEVISVSAIDSSDTLASFSNYGSTIELSAPGVGIYSTIRASAGSYGTMSGTSMACPHVAGVAALIKSQFPTWGVERIRERLRNSAEDIGESGWDELYGYGVVNAYQGVLAPEVVDIKVEFSPPTILGVNKTVQLTAIAKNIGQNLISTVELQIWSNDTFVDSTTITNLASNEQNEFSFSFSPSMLGTLNLTAKALPLPSENVLTNNIEMSWVKVVSPEKSIGAIYSHNELHRFSEVREFYEKLGYSFYEIFEPLNELSLDAFGSMFISGSGFGWSIADRNLVEQFIINGGKVFGFGDNLNDEGILTIANNYGISTYYQPKDSCTSEVFDKYHPVLQGIQKLPIPVHDDNIEISGGAEAFLFDPQDNSIVGASVEIGTGHLAIISSDIYLELYNAEGNVEQLLKNLVNWTIPKHNMHLSLEVPEIIGKDSTVLLNLTISNTGLSNETAIHYELYINNTQVLSKTISSLLAGEEVFDNYSWTPSEYYHYPIEAFIVPVTEETLLKDNNRTIVAVTPDPQNSIAFIYSHGEREISLATFYQALGKETFDIYTTITTELLSSFSVVFVGDGNNPWRSNEIVAVETFIQSGGTFIAFTGFSSFSNCLEELGDKYGISSNGVSSSLMGSTSMFEPYHPLLAGVSRLYLPTSTYRELVLSKMATAFLWDNSAEHIIGASVEVASGQFCVISSCLDDEPYNENNEVLLENILSWSQPAHDLILHITQISTELNQESEVNISIFNSGLYTETNVHVQLFLDGFSVANFSVASIASRELLILTYMWAPNTNGIFNFTAVVDAVPSEQMLLNNLETKLVHIVSNYYMTAYSSFNWIDPTIGTQLSLSFNSAIEVALPFAFQFYDQVFSTMYIGSNGVISFYNSLPYWGSNVPFPTQEEEYFYLVAPFWDQMVATGEFYVLSLTNPNRIVVGYVNMQFATGYDAGTFEVIFYESGEILFQYAHLVEIRSPTIGLNYGDVGGVFYNEFMFPSKTVSKKAILFTMKNKQYDLAATLATGDYFKVNNEIDITCSAENIGLNNEVKVILSLWIDSLEVYSRSSSSLAPSSTITFNYSWRPSVFGGYNITLVVQAAIPEATTLNNRISTVVRIYDPSVGIVGILNAAESERPNYFSSIFPWQNDYQTIATGLMNKGFSIRIITNADIMNDRLLDLAVLILVGNSPDGPASIVVKEWAHQGGNVIAFDKSIIFLNWAGILALEAECSSGLGSYWEYGSSVIDGQFLASQHYLAQNYPSGKQFSSNAYCGYKASIRESLAGEYFIPVVYVQILDRTVYLVSAYRPNYGGRFVHFWDPAHWGNAELRTMITNAINWVQFTNDPATIKLIEPNIGGTLEGIVHIQWTASDWEGDDLVFSLSFGDGENWTTIASNLHSMEYYWDTTEVANGRNLFLKVIAYDGFSNNSDVCDMPFDINNVTTTEKSAISFTTIIFLPLLYSIILLYKKRRK